MRGTKRQIADAFLEEILSLSLTHYLASVRCRPECGWNSVWRALLSLLKNIFGPGICLPVRIATGDYLFAE